MQINSTNLTQLPVAASIDDAQAQMLRIVEKRIGTERINLRAAMGRAAAREVYAVGDQPRFDAAAMDGWAVNGDGPGLYRLVGESRAGQGFQNRIEQGQAISISTGAPLPADTKLMVRREDGLNLNSWVEVLRCQPGRDVRRKGCDFRHGDLLLAVGTLVDHLDVARLAATGSASIEVFRAPRIDVLATGDELVSPGMAAGPFQSYDALSPSISYRLAQIGADVRTLGIAGDDDFSIAHRAACSDADLVVLIGGASNGRHDRARESLSAQGLSLMICGIAMRPGKPFWCGTLADGRLVVGLPGNPISALAAIELFVIPAIRRLMGQIATLNWHSRPELDDSTQGDEYDRVRFAIASQDGDAVAVKVLGGADNAALMPVKGANALVRLSRGRASYVLLNPNRLF